jgi:hypothetical protein
MIELPLAHAGHALATAPFFAPPLAVSLGLVVMIVRDRLQRRGDDPEETS